MTTKNGLLPPSRKRQRGQTLVIFACIGVVVFGFAGLSLDAGHIYMTQRLEQNAADAAAIAGGKRVGASIRSAQLSSSNDPSLAPAAVHDYASANGYSTLFSTACDSTTAGQPQPGLMQFSASWVDTGSCTAGFNTKVTIYSPPTTLTSNCSEVPYNCIQVDITQVVHNYLMGALGIPTTTVFATATVLAMPPSNTVSMPPSVSLYLYELQATACAANGKTQCFAENTAPSRTQLGATGNSPTFWSLPGSSPLIAGVDGHTISAGDTVALESAGDMVLQDPTTFCDAFGGACAPATVVGTLGYALASGAPNSALYCSASTPTTIAPIACTTGGPGGAALNASFGNETSFSSFNWTPLITPPSNTCGSLVLDGDTVANSLGAGACNPPSSDPFLILPGIYSYIVINHGNYEFGPGVYQITGTAPQNTAAAGTLANGIDHSQETVADWDLCPPGTSPCTATAGIWITHGAAPFVTPAAGGSVECQGGGGDGGGGGSGSTGTGGGDVTVVTGSGVTFQFTGTAGGFVSTHEVAGVTLSAPGVGSQKLTSGAPILFDLENSKFIHLDATPPAAFGGGSGGNQVLTVQNQFSGMIYQFMSASAGGVEVNSGLGGSAAAIRGQVLAYSYTAFGTPGVGVNFTGAYGAGAAPPPSTNGRNEPEIYGTPAATLTPAKPGFQTLTWHYTDEWKLDAYSMYVKINNGAPIYFSQGIWSPAPVAGQPLPPLGNIPGDASPDYPNVTQDPGNNYTHTASSTKASDWTMNYSDGSTFEVIGNWAWGHENGKAGAVRGTNVATGLYTFPTPPGGQSTITIFMSDGDRCGDWVTVTLTLNNAGSPNPGQQTVGTLKLEQ